MAIRSSLIVPASLAVIGTGTAVLASGFALKEQSPAAQGTAFAGASASADDPSAMFFNPAAVALLPGSQMVMVGNYIQPHAKAKRGSADSVTGAPLSGSTREGDIGGGTPLPAIYATHELPQGWAVGLAITAPFGLGTEYSDNWVGRYHGLKSELRTININPVIAWRATSWLSVGLGFQAQWNEAELTSAVDFGTIGALSGVPGAVPGTADGHARIKGDDWGYGFTAGALIEPGVPGLRVGVAFRSQVSSTLRGDADFGLDTAGIGAFLSGVSGAFVDTQARAALKTPASASLGFRQEIGERWALLGEVAWTDWSTFKQLRVDFENPAQPASITEQRWNDTWFGALGATYRLDERWTLRAGVAYDQSPVTDKHRTPRVPDSDRYWISVGAGYRASDWLSLDVAFTHIMIDDAEVRLSTGSAGNATRGSLNANYESRIELLALSATMRF